MEYGHGHAGLECPEGPGPVPVNGAVHGADGIDAGCTKGSARGYGGVFPVPGTL